MRILRYETDLFAQFVLLDLASGDVVVIDITGVRRVEAEEEFHQGGLAGAGRADECDALTFGHLKGDVLHRVVRRGLMTKRDALIA